MKKILLLTTGGTIASRPTEEAYFYLFHTTLQCLIITK